MKSGRHEKILELISKNSIRTQEDICRYLQEEGYVVTQATVSRDIRDLGLQKVPDKTGGYRYTAPRPVRVSNEVSLSSRNIVSVSYSMNNVVIKTVPGMANPIATRIDSLPDESVLGCVAGDDCIIIVTTDAEASERLAADVIESNIDTLS